MDEFLRISAVTRVTNGSPTLPGGFQAVSALFGCLYHLCIDTSGGGNLGAPHRPLRYRRHDPFGPSSAVTSAQIMRESRLRDGGSYQLSVTPFPLLSRRHHKFEVPREESDKNIQPSAKAPPSQPWPASVPRSRERRSRARCQVDQHDMPG